MDVTVDVDNLVESEYRVRIGDQIKSIFVDPGTFHDSESEDFLTVLVLDGDCEILKGLPHAGTGTQHLT
jgi:hypothetical protein